MYGGNYMNKPNIASLVIQGVAMILCVTALIVGNNLTQEFELAITTELCPGVIDEDTMSSASVSGQEMSALVMEEGAVLLKNADLFICQNNCQLMSNLALYQNI